MSKFKWINFACPEEEKKKFNEFCKEGRYSQTKYIKLAVNERSGKKIFSVK